MIKDVLNDMARRVYDYRMINKIYCNPDIDMEISKKFLYNNYPITFEVFITKELNNREHTNGTDNA